MNTDLTLKIRSERIGGLLKRRSVKLALVAVLGAGGLLVLTAGVLMRGGEDLSALPIFVVQRGPLTIDVVQAGTIQNRDLVKVRSEVEGRNSIIELAEEGTEVKQGDLLVKLDSSQLEDRRDSQQIGVKNSETNFIQAREKLAITLSQGDSDKEAADLAYRFAQIDLKKYLEGDYPQELKQAEAAIKLAEESYKQANDQLDWSQRLEKEGYIMRSELEQHELEATRKQLEVDLAKQKLDVLKQFTYTRKLEELQSNVEQTKAALERTRRRTAADVLQAEVAVAARQSEFERGKETLKKLEEQIGKCSITAPVAGMVVYATTGGNRGRREPLDKGQEVIQRQELIYLPVSTSMTAEAKVPESALKKITKGLSANVKVDAAPGKVFRGQVGKIGLYPDPLSFRNPDLKVYSTEVYIEGAAKELRAGMNCEVQIIVEEHPDALYIPVQAVMRVKGAPTVYVVGPNGPEPREVKIGLDNNRMIHILEGVSEGEKVMLAPPLGESAAPLNEQLAPDTEQAPKPAPMQPETNGPAAPAAETPIDPAKLRDMSPEERRQYMDSLTPEQRQRLMQGRQRGAGGGAGRAGRGGEAGSGAGGGAGNGSGGAGTGGGQQ